MKRQLREVDAAIARDAYWNQHGRPATERLNEANDKLTADIEEAIYIDLRPWHQRVNWPAVAVIVYIVGVGALYAYWAIRGFEALKSFLEAI